MSPDRIRREVRADRDMLERLEEFRRYLYENGES
jgi:hypothetical protein